MMASAEIRLSTTTMRRMPVLAQSAASGGSTTFVDPNDATSGIIATGSTTFADPNDATAGIIAVGYNQSSFHDLVQAQMTAFFRRGGVKVVNDPTICLPGAVPCGQPDIFGMNPKTGMLFAIEIKTGLASEYSAGQLNTYPHYAAGGALVSADPQLTQFGIFPGQALPPVALWFYIQLDNGTQGQLVPSPWTPPWLAPF